MTSNTPQLSLLATLSSPSGRGTRAWQSTSHPSPSVPLLATASSDKSVHVWSLRDFSLVSTISGGHKRSVRCVDWRDYGQKRRSEGGSGVDRAEEEDERGVESGEKSKAPVTLATGSFDANVGIWIRNDSRDQRSRRADINGDEDGELDVAAAELSRNSNGEEDEEWHFSTLLTGPDSEIKSIQFSPAWYGARLLATSSRDKSVWVWEEVEEEEWETIAVLGEHQGDVKVVRWNRGGRRRKRRRVEGGTRGVQDERDEEVEEQVLGRREILASGAYDDTIRLWRDVEEEGDWVCVGVIDGHQGTVWDLCWEGYVNENVLLEEGIEEWEARIASCSDDMTVRIWRRQLSEREKERKKLGDTGGGGGPRLPSVIRPASNYETWVEDDRLPEVHYRSIYAIDWSEKTGLLVSCGGDGTIAVYEEVRDEDVVMNGTNEHDEQNGDGESDVRPRTKWIVVALFEAAHEEYEINHVCWAGRRDKDKIFDEEEVIISTGDDSDVRVWALPEDLVKRISAT